MPSEEEKPQKIDDEQDEKVAAKYVVLNLLKWVGGFILLVLLCYLFLYLSERFFT